MQFRSQTGGRREMEKRALAAEALAQELQAALKALMPGEEKQGPPGLAAAASAGGPDGQAVRMTVDGHAVTAVVGAEGGSAAEWQAAIREGLQGRIAS